MTDFTDSLMRHSIDMAVANATGEARRELDEAGCAALTHRVARLAATLAVETYRAYHRSQVAMIEFHHETRAKEAMLRPPLLYYSKDPACPNK